MELVNRNAPQNVLDKAKQHLNLFKEKVLIPHKLYRTKYLVIYVNKSWRLLSKDKGENWILMIYHEFDRHI
ncbi:hypothetical protein L8T07_08785 [Enterobacter asburiae]|uniref:ParE family toxin-like protein n=1 Tax=Enterobacter TaxID=547 RepID=UPI001C631999|nr:MULTISPECIES: hypothetical protein [Enterobacter]MCK6667831.1 hypothetical protein [Enterobacter asburiae]QYH15945.1 hypothetical protein HB664_07815 [Enterobacter sp. DNB-S2]